MMERPSPINAPCDTHVKDTYHISKEKTHTTVAKEQNLSLLFYFLNKHEVVVLLRRKKNRRSSKNARLGHTLLKSFFFFL